MTFKKRKNFVDYLNTLNSPIGIEIGIHRGHFMTEILEGCKTVKMFAVDLWMPSDDCPDPKESYQMCRDLVKKYNGRLELIREWSNDAAAFFRDEYFDFIYLDAAHDKKSITEDVEAWYPKCKIGGLYAGHDYKKFVKEVVDKKFGCDKIQSTAEVGGSWWIFKPQQIIPPTNTTQESFVSCELAEEDCETQKEQPEEAGAETTGDCI